MIIFQTAGGGDAGSFRIEGLLDSKLSAPATTFRTNDYIHHLNRALQAEMRAISVYHSLVSTSGARPVACAEQHGSDHQFAGKELVRLIIANRGIPDDRAAISLGLTKTFVQFCAKVPVRIFARVTIGTLLTMERQLGSSYRRLLAEAPSRDHEVLVALLQRSESHVKALSNQTLDSRS